MQYLKTQHLTFADVHGIERKPPNTYSRYFLTPLNSVFSATAVVKSLRISRSSPEGGTAWTRGR